MNLRKKNNSYVKMSSKKLNYKSGKNYTELGKILTLFPDNKYINIFGTPEMEKEVRQEYIFKQRYIHLTWNFIKNNPDERWKWKELLHNKAITVDVFEKNYNFIVKKLPRKSLDLITFLSNPNLKSYEDFDNVLNIIWDTYFDIENEFLEENVHDEIGQNISRNPNITLDLIFKLDIHRGREQNETIYYDWYYIFQHLPYKDIKRIPNPFNEKKLSKLSRYGFRPGYWSEHDYWSGLSHNQNLPPDFVKKNYKLLNWSNLNMLSNYNFDVYINLDPEIVENFNEDDIFILGSNSNLDYKDLINLNIKFNNRLPIETLMWGYNLNKNLNLEYIFMGNDQFSRNFEFSIEIFRNPSAVNVNEFLQYLKNPYESKYEELMKIFINSQYGAIEQLFFNPTLKWTDVLTIFDPRNKKIFRPDKLYWDKISLALLDNTFNCHRYYDGLHDLKCNFETASMKDIYLINFALSMLNGKKSLCSLCTLPISLRIILESYARYIKEYHGYKDKTECKKC